MSKIVFTNGCFDVIHRGHIELFEFCHSLGDIVVVGLNSDDSVRRLKGPTRPINNQIDREFVLKSIKYVDLVLLFEESTPYELIKKVEPDVLVKGGDYDVNENNVTHPKYIVGKDIVKQTVVFPYKDGYSTTNILSKI